MKHCVILYTSLMSNQSNVICLFKCLTFYYGENTPYPILWLLESGSAGLAEKEGERSSFHLLVHFSNAYNSQN